MKKKILITGGAGFIGMAVARALHQQGCELVVFDLPDKLRQHHAEVAVVGMPFAGDVADVESWEELKSLAPFAAVVHAAAQTSGRISHEDPTLDLRVNALGTLNLANWCVAAGVRRVIYTSSMAVYGNPEQLPIAECAPTRPISNYGINKLAGELYLEAQPNLDPTILRLFNVYGPGQNLANLKQGMASIYLAYVLAGETVPVTGGFDRFRDFVYIDDVVAAVVAALGNTLAIRRIYNVGSGERTTVRQLLDEIIRASGGDPATYPVANVGGHTGDQFGMVADARLIARELGWRSTVSLTEGIDRMTAWARDISIRQILGMP